MLRNDKAPVNEFIESGNTLEIWKYIWKTWKYLWKTWKYIENKEIPLENMEIH